jgi:asparagine synthase (glutamine-hydrolysing)
MGGLCGWLGTIDEGTNPSLALEAMATKLPDLPNETTFLQAQRVAGLAVKSTESGSWFGNERGQWFAIDGEPTWSDPALASFAQAHGNGRALAEAYLKYDLSLFTYIQGAFSLAIVDTIADKAIIAIDRFGIKPMTYHCPSNAPLAFASSADSLRAHAGVTTDLSLQSIFHFVYFSVVPAPQTIYAEVQKLLPGEYLVFQKGELKRDFYFQLSYRSDYSRSLDSLSAELFERLEDSVRGSLDGWEPNKLGVFLSGGLDSSTVLGMATQTQAQPVKSFTISFEADEYDELHYASAAARHFASPHTTYEVKPAETADLISQIARIYDEPFGNSSAVPTFFCASLARENGVTLLLAGDGGDELFAGNARYILQQKFELYSRLPSQVRSLIEFALSALPAHRSLPLIRKIQGYVRRARIPMPDRLETYNYLESRALREVFDPEFLSAIDTDGARQTLRTIYDRSDATSLLQRMLQCDLQLALADNDLRKVTGMCESVGVQVRFPFLQEDLVKYATSIPPDILIKHFRIRHFFKNAMGTYLPPETIGKQKQGFGLPFRLWAQEPGVLRDLVGDTLDRFKRRHIVRDDFLDGLLSRWNTEDAKIYGQFVWCLVILEHWIQTRDNIL